MTLSPAAFASRSDVAARQRAHDRTTALLRAVLALAAAVAILATWRALSHPAVADCAPVIDPDPRTSTLLLGEGWTGDPTDRREALYPPGCVTR